MMNSPSIYEAWVGLGASLGDRLTTLKSACHCLGGWSQASVQLVGTSSIYATAPVGPASHEFYNGVAKVHTTLAPKALLARLLHIESLHGRTRQVHWGDRSLDLDLLLMRPMHPQPGPFIEADDEDLCLPHPRIWQRDFVLIPLMELSPNLRLKGRPLTYWHQKLPVDSATIRGRVCPPLGRPQPAPQPAAALR